MAYWALVATFIVDSNTNGKSNDNDFVHASQLVASCLSFHVHLSISKEVTMHAFSPIGEFLNLEETGTLRQLV